MTAAGTSPAPPTSAAAARSSARVPFHRLLDVELRKTVDTRASAALLAGVAGIAALVIGALAVWGREDELGLAYLAGSVAYPLQLVVPMVAALAVTGEWTQRGALTTFALVPRRGRVVGAKGAAGLLVAVATSLFSFALSALGTAVGSATRGIDPVWDLSLDAAARLTLLLVVATAVGFAFAVVIRASAPTLVAYLLFMLILPPLSSMLAAVFDGYAAVAPWVDLSTTMSVLSGPSVAGEQWAQLGVATLVWVALPLVLGMRRLLRVEIR